MLDFSKPESVGFDSHRLSRVSSWLEDQVETDRLAGASILIARRGAIAMCESTGEAEQATGKAFTTDSIARIYSMTKPVTSVAAMMLYERGCFHLNDPIALYLPEFTDTPVWLGGSSALSDVVPQQTPITVKQLMIHTSGLTYSFMHSNVVDGYYRENGLEFPGATVKLEEMINRLAEAPLLCQPGSQWNYSVATDVLGRLIEVWSGKTLQAFFKDEILEPLGMVDTDFYVDSNNLPRFTALYGPGSGIDLSSVGRNDRDPLSGPTEPSGVTVLEGVADSRFASEPTLFSGGGGLTSTMFDYARFCQMLMNKGEFNGTRLLGRKTVEYMRLNHLPDGKDMAAMGQPVWSETSVEGIGFGLGFAVVVNPVKAQIITSRGEHHWGGAASTFFWLDPIEDVFVIFFTQLLPSSTYPLRPELRARVYQALAD